MVVRYEVDRSVGFQHPEIRRVWDRDVLLNGGKEKRGGKTALSDDPSNRKLNVPKHAVLVIYLKVWNRFHYSTSFSMATILLLPHSIHKTVSRTDDFLINFNSSNMQIMVIIATQEKVYWLSLINTVTAFKHWKFL